MDRDDEERTQRMVEEQIVKALEAKKVCVVQILTRGN